MGCDSTDLPNNLVDTYDDGILMRFFKGLYKFSNIHIEELIHMIMDWLLIMDLW